MLIEELVERARTAGVHVMVGAIDGDNAASLRFHERLGFTVVARMPEVGRKFDRWLDLVLVLPIDPFSRPRGPGCGPGPRGGAAGGWWRVVGDDTCMF